MKHFLLACAFVTFALTPVSAQQVPTSPNPVAVTLDPKITALMLLDVAESPCNAQPECVALVTRIASLTPRTRGKPLISGAGGSIPLFQLFQLSIAALLSDAVEFLQDATR